MSKVTIAGDANGTGVFTIAAPNGNTNRTLVLPDEAGTLLTSAGAIAVDASAPDNSLVVTSAGNVGVGTSSPTVKLHASGSSTYVAGIEGSSTGAFLGLRASGSGGSMADPTVAVGANADNLLFRAGGAERARITSGGDLLVGKTADSFGTVGAKIGSDSTVMLTKTISDGGGAVLYLNRLNVNGAAVLFYKDTTAVGSISVTGSATAYNTSSDYRLKEDWVAVANASTRVNALKPVNFAWKADGSRVDGFLAHELAEVVPEAVTGSKDAMRDEEYEVSPAVLDDEGAVVTPAVMGTRSVPDYQGIDQSKLVPLLTAALQEALAAIESLTARVSALEAK